MKTKKKSKVNITLKEVITAIITIAFGVASGLGVGINIKTNGDGSISVETKLGIELSEKQIPATIENEAGETIIDNNIVTVEEVNTNTNECKDGEECGRGEYIYAPTETPQTFKDYVYGKCWDLDHHYGAQCWDLAELYWLNYAGRDFSTCGTGAAKGAWNCKEQNAGEDFELVYDPAELQAGDWIIFSSGTYGHVGMAMGDYNNGYISLLGQNQGGSACDGGGSSANIINISLKSFVGAFRPKTYIKPEPTPIPISKCVEWHVQKGDTMSKIMLECEGTIVYGEPMNAYAKTWYSLIYNKGKSVYDGWTSSKGVGLYENDDIEHRI